MIWDWNGTLVNDAFIFVSLVNGYLSSYNLKNISIVEYKNTFCFPVSDYYQRLGFSLSNKEFQALSADFIKNYEKVMFSASLVPGIKELLLDFSVFGYKQFLLSAQERSLLLRSVNYYGLNSFFVSVLGLKNNYADSKKALARALVKKHCSHKDILVVIGDTLHDFEVAQDLRAHCCLVSYGHNSLEKLTKTGAFVAENIQDIKQFIHQVSLGC